MGQRVLLERAEKSVVHHHQRAVALLPPDLRGDARDQRDVGHAAGGVGGRLHHHQRQAAARGGVLCGGADCRLVERVGDADWRDAEADQVGVEQAVCAAVDGSGVQHCVAGAQEGLGDGVDRRHAAVEAGSILGAVEHGQACLQHGEVRVIQPGVDVVRLGGRVVRRGRAEVGLVHVLGVLRAGVGERGRGVERRLDRAVMRAGVVPGGDGVCVAMHQDAKPSFLKKRSKKLLFPGHPSADRSATAGPKVFWFFFSKKNCLLAFMPSASPKPAQPARSTNW